MHRVPFGRVRKLSWAIVSVLFTSQNLKAIRSQWGKGKMLPKTFNWVKLVDLLLLPWPLENRVHVISQEELTKATLKSSVRPSPWWPWWFVYQQFRLWHVCGLASQIILRCGLVNSSVFFVRCKMVFQIIYSWKCIWLLNGVWPNVRFIHVQLGSNTSKRG